jgi:hypothetical protein
MAELQSSIQAALKCNLLIMDIWISDEGYSMNKQKPMKHTWGIWISFLNWIARFSSTILLSDGANKANTTWLMKCLSFIRLQFLLPKNRE